MSNIQPTKISCIIPLYYCDTSLFIPINNCLMGVRENYPDFELIVIDDCSPLEVYEQWPITSYNDENRGFTKTVNKGLALATGEILIVLNDDITVHKGQLDHFLELDPLSSTIASISDTASSPGDLFGACWAITRTAYETLGPLDEQYVNFFSDAEYYLRAKNKGVTVVRYDDVVLDHPESSTFKLLDKETLLKADQSRYDNNINPHF